MKKLLTIILILISISSIGQITWNSYPNKGAANINTVNASYYQLNGVSLDSANTVKRGFFTKYQYSKLQTAYGWGNWASNFGTTSGTIAQGNDSRINNGQTAYGWGNHAGLYKGSGDSVNMSGYATQYDLTQHLSSQWTTSGSNIYYDSGNVGIGTNLTPYRLNVSGVTFLQMPDNTADAFRLEGEDKYISCNTGTAGKTIIFDEAGIGIKVGINKVPTSTLDVDGQSKFRMPADMNSAFAITGPVAEDDYLSFHTGTAGKVILFDETNIGVKIGVSKTPTYKLDVKGPINADSLYVGGVKKNTVWDAKESSLGNPSINGYVLSSLADGTRSWVAQTGGSSQWTTIGNNVQFPNNTNNYYVGLGTYTTTIAAPLHLYFDDPSIRIQERINNYYWDILTEAGTGDFRVSTSAHPSSIHVVNSTGYTGIGKTPTQHLDVMGNINGTAIYVGGLRKDSLWSAKQDALTNAVTGTGIRFINDSIKFYTNGSLAAVLDTSQKFKVIGEVINAAIEIDGSGSFSATLTNANTYYTLYNATYLNDLDASLFSYNETTGEITYIGTAVKKCAFHGSANISIDDISNLVTFGLHQNGTLIPNADSPHTFSVLDEIEYIGINKIVTLNPNDVFTVRAKCNESGHTLTVNSIQLTFWE